MELQGLAVMWLVGAGPRVCPGNPRGLPRRGKRRGSSRQGSRGPVLRAVPEHCRPQEEHGIEPQAQGLP